MKRQLTWTSSLLITFGVAAAGFFISITVLRQLYFIPAAYDIKVAAYWLLNLVWIPVLFLFFLRKPARGRIWVNLVIGAVLLGISFTLCSVGIFDVYASRPWYCAVSVPSSGKTRYECQISSDTEVFEADPGHLLMTPVPRTPAPSG